MHEFETFAYLDLQKTGSTFISDLLKRYSTEKEVLFSKHSRVGQQYDSDKFYFISVRDPMSQYLSLYSYGCSGSGGLYKRIRNAGFEQLYNSSWSGFRRWLNFVLLPRNATFLDRAYGNEKSVHELLGYQSYRYIKLAMRGRFEKLSQCKSRDDIRKLYKKYAIVDFTIRMEHLEEDLRELVTTHLNHAISNMDDALRHISGGQRLRSSDRVDRFEEGKSLSERQTLRLQEREWLLHELFGY